MSYVIVNGALAWEPDDKKPGEPPGEPPDADDDKAKKTKTTRGPARRGA